MAPDVNKTSILLCTSGLRSADSGRTPGQFQTPEPGSERSLPRRHPSLTRPQLTALSLSPSRIRPAPLPLRAAQEACSLSATNGPSAHVFNVEIKYLYASSIASHKLTPEAADAGRAHSHESEVVGRAAGCSGCHQDRPSATGQGFLLRRPVSPLGTVSCLQVLEPLASASRRTPAGDPPGCGLSKNSQRAGHRRERPGPGRAPASPGRRYGHVRPASAASPAQLTARGPHAAAPAPVGSSRRPSTPRAAWASL